MIKNVQDLPENTLALIKEKKVTYRGRGCCVSGVLLKVEGEEYIISDELFKELGWIKTIPFDAPYREE